MKKQLPVLIAVLALMIWGAYDLAVSRSGNDGEFAGSSGLRQGDAAPDFTLPTVADADIRLSDLRGRKVVLNMWASWCPPCVYEMPHLQAFYEDFQKSGVEVLAVNMTESEKSREAVTRFIAEHGLTFPVALDEQSRVADLYRVTTLPTSFILDPEGNIVQKIVGPLTYERLEDLISKVQ